MEDFRVYTDLLTEDDNGGVPLDYLGTVPRELQQSPIDDDSPISKPNQKHKGKNFSMEED